ncbi:MAG: PilZ domain-containing protein [Pseudomonadales bacterium]
MRSRPRRYCGVHSIKASYRCRYRRSLQPAVVLDYNRCGMAILTDQCLPDQTQVTISIEYDGIVVKDVVAVVHTCRRVGGLYRCGFQFRPDSTSQLDREDACTALAEMETRLAELEDATSSDRDTGASERSPGAGRAV